MSMIAYPRTKEDLERIAADLGCDVVFSGPHDILLDVDPDKISLVDVEENIARHEGGLELTEKVRWTSRGGQGTHIHLVSNLSWTPIERFMIQLFLGSDPDREKIGMKKYLDGTDLHPCLFKPKEKS